jgi:polyisoprenoid-binding protein YceI
MKENIQAFHRNQRDRLLLLVLALFVIGGIASATQELVFRLDPQHSTVSFLLGDAIHTVRGAFRLKESALRLDPASGKITGEIIVDARSGESGSGMRDRKMHREVLESERYPEIAFRPDRVDGTVSVQGKSSVRVHGVFNIHGSDHELTVPAEVEVSSDHWTATLHFAVPYVNWGMKNPSNLFLKVNESVDIDLTASGTITRS